MRLKAVRRAERYLGLAALAGFASAAGAQETRTAVVVSTGGSVETNPYNTVDTSGAAIAATAEIRPLMRWRSESTTVDLAGLASFRQFSRRFGLEDNYSLDGSVSSRVSERMTVRSNAGFAYRRNGFNDFGRTGLLPGIPTFPGAPTLPGGPTPPGLTPDLPNPILIDPTLLGVRTRTRTIQMGVGTTTQLGANSSLSLDLNGLSNRFGEVGFGNFNNVGGQLAYSHRLNETTSIGIVGGLSKVDYLGTRLGDARTTSLRGSIDRRINENWTVSASAGLANTRSQLLPGLPDRKFSSLTAQIQTCNQGERGRFCLAGSRSPEPSAVGSVRVNTSIQGDYSYRLTARETITASGSYTHTGGDNDVLSGFPAAKFASAALRYDNQIRDNLSLYTGTNFSRIYADNFPRRANFGVNAGIQYRFGALQ